MHPDLYPQGIPGLHKASSAAPCTLRATYVRHTEWWRRPRELDQKPAANSRACDLPKRAPGFALSQGSTTTKTTSIDRHLTACDLTTTAITILRERISTWVVVDILELF